MKKRIYTAAGLFLAAALVLGGCGKEKVPESEFATADEAKEALTSAETIEINPVNTGVQIYETVAVVFVLILLIGSSFSKWRQKKKN